jgi:hypothetical protein
VCLSEHVYGRNEGGGDRARAALSALLGGAANPGVEPMGTLVSLLGKDMVVVVMMRRRENDDDDDDGDDDDDDVRFCSADQILEQEQSLLLKTLALQVRRC